MVGVNLLGEFLAARRAQLRPADVGLTSGFERRRVPGLRREELAQLAGVSPSYYTRLEQGQSRRASPEVLDALAVALRLGDDERDHLRRLADPGAHRSSRRSTPQHAHPATRDLLTAMAAVPAWVQGRHTDILLWNPLGHAVLAGHLPADAPECPRDRPTTAELIFADPHGRELYDDWERKARAVVGNLRQAAGRFHDDAALAHLVGRLSIGSAAFADLWADHRIRACDAAAYVLHHPVIGTITVTQQSFAVVAAPDQSLITMTGADAPSVDALQLLYQTLSPGALITQRVAGPCAKDRH